MKAVAIAAAVVICVLFALPGDATAGLYSPIKGPADPTVAGISGAGKQPRTPIVLIGNSVIMDNILWSTAGLTPETIADSETIKQAANKIARLYQDSGYTLSHVEYREADGSWFILVDEGRLEQIIVVGASNFQTVYIRSEMYLPFNVYNKFLVDNAIVALSKPPKSLNLSTKIVDVKDVDPRYQWFQLPSWILSLDQIPPEIRSMPTHKHNLIIEIRSSDSWGTGLGYGVSYSGGILGLEGNYSGQKMFVLNDRYNAFVNTGGEYRTSLNVPSNSYITFTMANGGLTYYTPPLAGQWLRLVIPLSTAINHPQRKDIPLDSYWLWRNQISANSSFEFKKNQSVSFGLGVQHNDVFDPTYVNNKVVPIITGNFVRLVVNGGLTMNFSDKQVRQDLRHTLDMSLSGFFRVGHPEFGQLQANWKRSFLYGYNELKVAAAAYITVGKSTFIDEVPLTWGPFHSDFNQMYYVRNALYQNVDFGLSVLRDIVLIHAMVEAAQFGVINRNANYDETFMGAFSMGPGISTLIYDSFLLSFYYFFGVTTNGFYNWESSLNFSKVF
ncbi:MAG: hypothetical protein WC889_13825 [Myxococcota bacterium]|jgi:hypothetical protein